MIKNDYSVQTPCIGNGNCAMCKVQGCSRRDAFLKYDEKKQEQIAIQAQEDAEYHIAIDLGTTTLVFQLIEASFGTIVHTVTLLNSQRKFGADVLSRIQASVEGKRQELQECIRKDLLEGIAQLKNECNVKPEQIKDIVIAGNTTMIHLLMGYDCSGLGVYPFTPVNMDVINDTADAILGLDNTEAIQKTLDITIFPGISAFVGGDIVSGLYELDFANKNEISLFIDLGTNGEMALGNKEKLLVTSVAAGPAFEMGPVTWGSNVIEIVSGLLENGIIDETGLLADEYFDDGYPIGTAEDGRQIIFNQKDVRDLQLAKAAVRAGVETLIKRYEITSEQIAKVYLAGGFGSHLDVDKAAVIGMLPKELAEKAEIIGNSSLAGCVKFLRDEGRMDFIQSIKDISEPVMLAKDTFFEKKYMENMSFSL